LGKVWVAWVGLDEFVVKSLSDVGGVCFLSVLLVVLCSKIVKLPSMHFFSTLDVVAYIKGNGGEVGRLNIPWLGDSDSESVVEGEIWQVCKSSHMFRACGCTSTSGNASCPVHSELPLCR